MQIYFKIKKNTQNTQLGFTLVEMLVVIAIIGILASFLLVNFVGVKARARDAQRKSDLKQIQAALEFYRSDNGLYPDAGSGAGLFPTTCGGTTALTNTTNTVTYINKIPCDPSTTNPYTYVKSAAGKYCVKTCLENPNDKLINTDSCGATACASGNFVQTNP